MIFLLALVIGIVAGLRTFTAPAAVSWAANLGWLNIGDSVLAFLGYRWTPWILTGLAVVEFVTDQLPSTPSRTVPMQFGARIVTGAVSGAALGIAFGAPLVGGVAGIAGAIIGTFGGRTVRAKLADTFHRDMPAAIIEDAVAVLIALLVIMAAR